LLPELRAQRCRGNSTQPRHGRQADDNNYWELAKKHPSREPNRLPSPHHFVWGRLGRGVWRMGLGVLSRPAGCRSYLRPCGVSAPYGTVPVSGWSYLRGHLRGAGAISGHPCGGTETGSNRADARRSLKATMHGLELSPHAWWLFR